jgi:hypothetical protein
MKKSELKELSPIKAHKCTAVNSDALIDSFHKIASSNSRALEQLPRQSAIDVSANMCKVDALKKGMKPRWS